MFSIFSKRYFVLLFLAGYEYFIPAFIFIDDHVVVETNYPFIATIGA